jgi:hypothetical protein
MLVQVDDKCQVIADENKKVEGKINNFIQLMSSQLDINVSNRVKKEY